MKEDKKHHGLLKDRTGEKRITKMGDEVEIIKYINSNNITVRFNNEGVIKNTDYYKFKHDIVENPYWITVYGVGYLGEIDSTFKFKLNHKKLYAGWIGVMSRCYNEASLVKRPTYKDVEICEEWCNFQNFAKWYDNNYIEGFHLDKDILKKGNKIYSPETCCFVPQEINSLLILCKSVRGKHPIGVTREKSGKFKSQFRKNRKNWNSKLYITSEEAFSIYKIEKEAHIKEIAKKWKPFIKPDVHQALINYQIEITD
jgi:hypothetical protein